jgi:peptidoglycan lytic transglycosylase G
MRRLTAALMIAAGVVVAVFAVDFVYFLQGPSEATQPQTLIIEKGMPFSKVVEELSQKGVIRQPTFFKVYVLLMQAAPKVRAGEYTFPPALKPEGVLDLLMKGDFATRRITIPEGWSNREIAKFLASQNLINEQAFLAKAADPIFLRTVGLPTTSLEGYLYPDTYEIYKPKNEEEVLRKLVGHFEEIWQKEFASQAAARGMSREDVVTLASIVEKETANRAERPLIASVFFNRLKIGMPLATDPAVIYGITNFNGNITKQDLMRPGPYNTYLNVGLPPTPIANPGADSIRAVLNPAQTDYLYFVSKNDGTHYFSRTEEEHNEAVKKYQIERYKPANETSPSAY